MLRSEKRSATLPLWQALLLAISLFIASTHLAQANVFCCGTHSCWQPFVTVGGGVAISSNGGRSQTFLNPVTGGLDTYSNNHAIQTVGSFDGFFGMAWAFHPKWELQMGLGYNQPTAFQSNGSVLQGLGTPIANLFVYQYRVIVRQYLVESKLLYNYYEMYHPYLVLGLGISQNNASAFQNNSSFPNSTINYNITRQFLGQNTSSFSYNVGFGIDIDVLYNVRLGLGYRFADYGKVKLGNAMINQIPVSGTFSQSNFYVHEGLAQVTFIL